MPKVFASLTLPGSFVVETLATVQTIVAKIGTDGVNAFNASFDAWNAEVRRICGPTVRTPRTRRLSDEPSSSLSATKRRKLLSSSKYWIDASNESRCTNFFFYYSILQLMHLAQPHASMKIFFKLS
jgi:hypothetical protein